MTGALRPWDGQVHRQVPCAHRFYRRQSDVRRPIAWAIPTACMPPPEVRRGSSGPCKGSSPLDARPCRGSRHRRAEPPAASSWCASAPARRFSLPAAGGEAPASGMLIGAWSCRTSACSSGPLASSFPCLTPRSTNKLRGGGLFKFVLRDSRCNGGNFG